jgi:tRNA-2-methylthio-N6-dimethylallyladenosine synthase
MSDHIIDKVAELDKVCEHINLPFQAGDDDVLRRMRRGYSAGDYRALIDKIRDRIPNVSLSTDLIVGFCGETDQQFERTLDMLRDVRFDKVHSAAYSTRDGTIAARKLVDDVPDEEKKARLKAIESLQEQVLTEINAGLQGQRVDVLVEDTRRGKTYGRNRNDKIVYVAGAEDRIGEVVTATVEATSPWSLQARLEAAA